MTQPDLPEYLWYVGKITKGNFKPPIRRPSRVYSREVILKAVDPTYRPNQKAHWLFLAADGSALVVYNFPKSIKLYPDLSTAKAAAALRSNL